MNSFFQPQNPLWRHIQRYATVAVIFPAAERPEQPTTAVPTNQPVVQATLPERATAEPVSMIEAAPTIIDSPLPIVRPQPSTIPAPVATTPSPPAQVQAKPDTQSKDEGASWSHLQSIVAHHRAKRAAEEGAATSSIMPESADLAQQTPPKNPPTTPSSAPGDERTVTAPQLQRSPSPYEQPTSAIPAETKPTTVTPAAAALQKRPNNSPPAEIDHPSKQWQPDSPLSETIGPWSVPLEAAWPVQKVESETADRPSPPTSEVAALPLTAADEQALRATLNKVEPSQPTDSAVDFNPPCRPRPTAASPQTVQRQPNPTAPAEMVPTEIGPLPADLWQLLDQKPPALPPPLAPSETVETAVTPPAANSAPPATSSPILSPLPDFEDQPGQPKPGQPQPIAADDGPDDLPGASQPEEQGTSSQNVLQRWPDDSLPLPDPAALELLNQPLASVTEAAALNPLALAPAVTDVVPLMMANTERPSFLSPPDISQPMQQLALPDLPNGLPPTLGAALPTTPDTISSRQQLQQLTQPDLPSNLPAPSIPDFPITPDTIPSTQQFQQMAQPELPNNLPTMPDTMPKLPTLGNGTAVAHNLPNSLSDLPTPETLLGLDDTADEANIDEIARQVYRHLKRRLEMEWERTRSRR